MFQPTTTRLFYHFTDYQNMAGNDMKVSTENVKPLEAIMGDATVPASEEPQEAMDETVDKEEQKESPEKNGDATRQRTGFTSEIFKIEINNLPKFFGVGEAKKLLVKKLGLNPHKIKPAGRNAKAHFA